MEHPDPKFLNDEEAQKLADELGRAEAEALRLFNEVLPSLKEQIVGYFNYVNRCLNGLGVSTEGDIIGYYAKT